MANNLVNVDNKILETITHLRDKYNACTARAVGAHLRMSADLVRHRVTQLRAAGFVDWNAMPGSLIVVRQATETIPEPHQDHQPAAPQEQAVDPLKDPEYSTFAEEVPESEQSDTTATTPTPKKKSTAKRKDAHA